VVYQGEGEEYTVRSWMNRGKVEEGRVRFKYPVVDARATLEANSLAPPKIQHTLSSRYSPFPMVQNCRTSVFWAYSSWYSRRGVGDKEEEEDGDGGRIFRSNNNTRISFVLMRLKNTKDSKVSKLGK